MYVGLFTKTHTKNFVCQNAWEELCGPNTRMLKVSFGWLKTTCDTRINQSSFSMDGEKNNVHLEMRKLKQRELQRLEEKAEEKTQKR